MSTKFWRTLTLSVAAHAIASGISLGATFEISNDPEKALSEITKAWVGEFDNHLQVRANLDRVGAVGPELSRERRELKAYRLDAPQLGKYVIFFEEYRANAPGTANRQRVISLVYDSARKQVRARQLFFNGEKHGRTPLEPAAVAKMQLSEFDLTRPGCDLMFRWEEVHQRYRGGMDPGACVSKDMRVGKNYIDYEMLLAGGELWYRDRTVRAADGVIVGEVDGFSWVSFTRTGTPHIAEQQGVWRGMFRRYDGDGKLAAEFPSEITMRVIPRNGKLEYHQTNHYFPKGQPEEIIQSYGEVRDGRIYFGNARLEGWKMDIPDDPTQRSAIILLNYKDGSGLYAHEIVSVSSDGRYRARATQYLKEGRIVRRTLIDEEKVTSDWAAYEAAQKQR
jgi:hypothetical protein